MTNQFLYKGIIGKRNFNTRDFESKDCL